MTAISSSQSVWIEDGVLFHQYHGEVTLERILENEKKSIIIINEQRVDVLPMIVLFKDISKTKFKLNITDYGKVITTFDFPEYISGIWVVETANEVKKFIDFISETFNVSKVRVAKDLQEAKNEAQLILSSSTTILEE